jgi:hypothetical protein
MSWVLELVRVFYASPRLMGYPILALILGCAPRQGAEWRWGLWAVMSLLVTAFNVRLVHGDGSTHPAYRAASEAIAPYLPQSIPIYTNSYRILDVNLGRATIPVENALPSSSGPACYLEFRMPNYDAVGPKVWPLPQPTAPWRLARSVGDTRLYCNE